MVYQGTGWPAGTRLGDVHLSDGVKPGSPVGSQDTAESGGKASPDNHRDPGLSRRAG